MLTAIVDYRITEEEVSNLEKLGLRVLACPPCKSLYASVNGHPDMQLAYPGNKKIIIQKEMDPSFLKNKAFEGFEIILSNSGLTEIYPQDIILNSLILGYRFVHKLKNTDAALLHVIKGMELINVNQGYTKCSTAIVNENAAITSDKGISSALADTGVDVLLVPPGDIDLPGLNYGFIGGTCGLIDRGCLAFFGELTHYAYGNEVLEFLKKHKVTPVYLKKGRLNDRGTLYCI